MYVKWIYCRYKEKILKNQCYTKLAFIFIFLLETTQGPVRIPGSRLPEFIISEPAAWASNMSALRLCPLLRKTG